MQHRVRINISGMVQGVGFRPFVHRVAHKLRLNGCVYNSGQGVVIEIQGLETKIEEFLQEIQKHLPKLSRIDTLVTKKVEIQEDQTFIIKRSPKEKISTSIVPDIALCENCLVEFHDPNNRRYHYPFISCSECGPRYTILKALPFDRPQTSMSNFPLCDSCQTEYEDSSNRRFHTQTLSCFNCGPQLSLLSHQGLPMERNSIDTCVELLKEGKSLAIKGLGGFHLICDASNQEAVSNLRKNKRRPAKPLAVMFPNINQIKASATVSKKEEALILSKEAPIVIVAKKKKSKITDLVTGSINKIGVFLPYTPLHLQLLEKIDRPLVVTSANLSEEPIISDEKQIVEKLSHVVTAILTHDRPIINACDDSVVMIAEKQELVVRMARGMAPKSFLLPFKSTKKILALGGQQKACFALAFDDQIILSPHIGDLDSLDSLDYFKKTLESFQKRYEFKPDLIVHDKHPEYETTKWAKSQTTPRLEIQHHYAHALACMAEYALNEEVLAFCFDGTGFGDDGHLWGGEVLTANRQSYQRIIHLRPFKLLGGNKAIKEPRRVALALLFECFSLDNILALPSPTVESFTKEEITTLHHIWENEINTPQTTSIGRLFDAIASLSRLAQKLSYEGQSGLLIETAAKAFQTQEMFDHTLTEDIIDWEPMLRELLQIDPKQIPSLFINMMVDLIIKISQNHPHLPVVLSGGVFQNQLLVSQLISKFKVLDIRYYIQKKTPVNDGGLALGQIYHALHKEKNS